MAWVALCTPPWELFRCCVEILDGTELYSVVEEAVAGSVVRGPSPEAGSEPVAGSEEWEEEE